jgi:hypothetical protein
MSVSLLFIEPKQGGRDLWDLFSYKLTKLAVP